MIIGITAGLVFTNTFSESCFEPDGLLTAKVIFMKWPLGGIAVKMAWCS